MESKEVLSKAWTVLVTLARACALAGEPTDAHKALAIADMLREQGTVE